MRVLLYRKDRHDDLLLGVIDVSSDEKLIKFYETALRKAVNERIKYLRSEVDQESLNYTEEYVENLTIPEMYKNRLMASLIRKSDQELEIERLKEFREEILRIVKENLDNPQQISNILSTRGLHVDNRAFDLFQKAYKIVEMEDPENNDFPIRCN